MQRQIESLKTLPDEQLNDLLDYRKNVLKQLTDLRAPTIILERQHDLVDAAKNECVRRATLN